ncbi:MDR family MFS transporter [Nostoc sp.]|uniref:MDR family MFS transporter n=1 Tax=Nostoc sp. TaxID=1180 RepID=UPI002FF8D281
MVDTTSSHKESSGSTRTALSNENHVSLKSWIAVSGTLLGAFMAILDIQITNSALRDIQGALSATIEEGSWISTAYLVAEIIVIPLTAYLARVFSVQRYLLVNVLLFLFFSSCCATAWNLESMIVFRVLQGFTGGVLIPMGFTTVLLKLPPAKQPIGFTGFMVAATFGPAIGPTIGGWLTENYGWQYIFYVNWFPGLLLASAVWYGLEPQPLQLQLLRRGDWWGILTMAIGLACLEVVLEEGNRKDWFESDLITHLAILAAISLTIFLWIELTRADPFINLRLLRQRNFGLSAIVNLVNGLGLYGLVYLIPLYLVQVQGYNALQIGMVLAWFGIPQLLILPFLPRLMRYFDLRLLIGVGMSLVAVSCLMNSTMTHDTGSDQLVISNIVRALGQPFILTPLSAIATTSLKKEQAGSASALFNIMRNLGGSIGIAALDTLLTRREQFHSERIGEAVSLYNLSTQQRLEQMTQFFVNQGSDLGTAYEQALSVISNMVQRESYVMAYNDCFYSIGITLLLSSLLLLFCKNVKANNRASAH